MTSEAKRASLPARPLSDDPRQKRETPRLQPLVTNRHRASQPSETAMTSERFKSHTREILLVSLIGVALVAVLHDLGWR